MQIKIQGKGIYIIKGILDGEHGKLDFKLTNIAMIIGFYINIVFKAKLKAIKLWVYGFDCILRFGNLKHSIIIKKLK